MTLALLITAVTGAWADIAVGNVFKTGSTIDFGTSSVRYKQFSGSSDNSSMGISGMVTLTYEEYSNGMHKFRFPTGSGAQFMYIVSDNTAEPWGIKVSGGEGTMGNPYSFEVLFKEQVSLSINNNKDEVTFNMPAFDATVDYELVRDMQDETNPVAFSGLPTNDEPIVVKKGSDGKYQPAEALTIQLIDPLAAAEAQNIIAADGITITAEKKGDGDTWTSGTFADFMADMQPGTYRLTATPKDETSPYDGTVTSGEFTLVEKYDLVVKPANDFSKNGLDKVTVGTEEITPDATTGKVTKNGIDPDTEVKLKAKRGYVFEKVEVKKTVQN